MMDILELLGNLFSVLGSWPTSGERKRPPSVFQRIVNLILIAILIVLLIIGLIGLGYYLYLKYLQ